MDFKTQEELDAALTEWQKRLSLQDYQISASIVRERDIDAKGICQVYADSLCGYIKLRDPIDFNPDDCRIEDNRDVLIHELLHFVLEPMHLLAKDEYKALGVATDTLEQAVNRLQRAFIELAKENEALREQCSPAPSIKPSLVPFEPWMHRGESPKSPQNIEPHICPSPK